MVHAVMADELAADLLVGLMFVRHQRGFAAEVGVNGRGPTLNMVRLNRLCDCGSLLL
jgi:hypothetical protein